ncbi:MAG: right-handed parallel beta-helix repeat-containing protein [Sedimentisphaerales bacterium]|nr:right-handed parallel beta-helix repeat-containing protein [Sedimentisphaerales bacterium]
MSRIFFLTITMVLLVLSSALLGYSGGSGTPEDPYRIASKADLLELAANAEDYNKCFILTADIDMEAQVFTKAVIAKDTSSSDGFQGTVFTGVFDGNSHKITNFSINGGFNDYLGLFGSVGSNGLVKNLGIENLSVSGLDFVGMLVGHNNGDITDCCSTGTASGDFYVGGLVGYNYMGSITNCYSAGTTNGDSTIGGLVGYNYMGNITNCCSTGSVSGFSFTVGGLVGGNIGNITDSYSTGDVGVNSSWDSVGVGGLVGSNSSSITNCYSTGAVSVAAADAIHYLGGLVGCNYSDGIITNCCSIGTVSATVASYIEALGGLVGANYSGSIINCSSTSAVSVDAADGITCFLGGLVGVNDSDSIITNCYSTGNVSAATVNYHSMYLGGLVGENSYSNISNCYSTGAVDGDFDVGGLVGNNYIEGNISDCYSTGAVDIGGGGLVGYKDLYSGTIANSFWDIQTSGRTTSAGGTGLNTAQMMQQASFTGWDFTTPVWTIEENLDYPKLWCEGNMLYVPGGYPTIQSAIGAAANGDVVLVAPGTYTGTGNRDIDFLGKTVTVRSIVPCFVAQTIIDCSSAGRGFRFHSGEDANSVLAGITITNGSAYYGGGIYCSGSSPTITNCTITGNSVLYFGGGIYCIGGCPVITNCVITGNSVGDSSGGGGIHCEDANSVITGCTINDNRGNGIGCEGSSGTITGCSISGNFGLSGGGISGGRAGASVSIIDCLIKANSDNGIRNCDGLIQNCTISENSAGSYGGGIANCDGIINNCTIANNSSESKGGGLYNCTGQITNCTFSGNSAEYGGGIFNSSSSLTVANCILWGNTATYGSQIYNYSNSTTTINFSNVQGGWTGTGNINADPYFVDADANDYHLKSEGWRWDTQRQVWTWDDVTSRCIDAGNPGSLLGDELLSVPDDPNNEWGQNLRIDMGAFGGTAEASIPPYDWALLSDITNDGISDLDDLDVLSSLWMNTGEQLYADFNRDEIIDLFDFALLAHDWLAQTSWH